MFYRILKNTLKMPEKLKSTTATRSKYFGTPTNRQTRSSSQTPTTIKKDPDLEDNELLNHSFDTFENEYNSVINNSIKLGLQTNVKLEENCYIPSSPTSPQPPYKKRRRNQRAYDKPAIEIKIETADLIKGEYEPQAPPSPSPNSKKSPKKKSPKKKSPSSSTSSFPTEPPHNFWPIYEQIRKMRKRFTAPVDTQGCATSTTAITGLTSGPEYRFQCLVSLMLSSQTKDEINHAALSKLHSYCKSEMNYEDGLCLEALLEISEGKLDELIRQVGFHNRKTIYLKKMALLLKENFNSDIPEEIEDVLQIPGVGPKMGFLVLQIAWGKTVGIGVDTHVDRIARMFKWVVEPKNKTGKGPEFTRKSLESMLWKEEDRYLWEEINPVLVGFGQVVCLPVAPRCDLCSIARTGLCPGANKSLVNKVDKELLMGVKGEDGLMSGKKSRGDLSLLIKDIEDLVRERK